MVTLSTQKDDNKLVNNQIPTLNQLKTLQFGRIKYWDEEAFIQANTNIMHLLTIPHKESTAGANPREFQGMKSNTNKKILGSMLNQLNILFTAHHQGVTVTVVGADSSELGDLKFEDGCLVNGLQTVTLARILVMIKTYQLANERSEIHKKINKSSNGRWSECIDNYFSPDAANQLHSISIDHINSVLNWLHQSKNRCYLDNLNRLKLEQFLNLSLTIKITLLDKLVLDYDIEQTEERTREIGMSIAEANNETQKVRADDLFGTKYKDILRSSLFSQVKEPFQIEYVRSENERNNPKLKIIHVLDILRSILPTTLLIEPGTTPETFVANYAAHRERVYNLFQKFLAILTTGNNSEKFKVQKIFNILQVFIPQLLDIRNEAEKLWQDTRASLSEDYIKQQWGIDLRSTFLANKIFKDKDENERKNSDEINRAIRENLGFSFTNAFPVFIFATRQAIIIDDHNQVSYSFTHEIIKQMVDYIYYTMVELRLNNRYSSTSDMFRDPRLYRLCTQNFRTISIAQNLNLHDYTKDFRETIL